LSGAIASCHDDDDDDDDNADDDVRAAVKCMMLCLGRDRSLQCSRTSLKSSATSDIQFCREHAPSGSTDLDRPPTQPDGADDKVVDHFSQTQSFSDEAGSISQGFDDAANRKTYLVLLSSLGAGDSDQTNVMLASFYALPRGLESCRTPDCYSVAGDGGYCVDCQKTQTAGSGQRAIEFPDEEAASRDDIGKVPSSRHREEEDGSELAADEVETRSLSQSGEGASADDAEPQHLADDGSSSSSSRPAAAESTVARNGSVHTSLCRGPYCNNAGVDRLRGLCMKCYRTLLSFNSGRHHAKSSADFGAE